MSADLDAIARRTHHLKCWPEHYENIIADLKPFEVRKDDRFFEVGDILDIHEFTVGVGFSGRSTQRKVLSKLAGGQFGIEPGYCVLGLSRASDAETYNHELDAGKRIIELEKEVAAFKANNRYMRGHTAGYEEAEEKYQQQLAQQSAALAVCKDVLDAAKRWHQGDKWRTSTEGPEAHAWKSMNDNFDYALAQLAEAPRNISQLAAEAFGEQRPMTNEEKRVTDKIFLSHFKDVEPRALTSGEATEAAEHPSEQRRHEHQDTL